MVDAPHKAKYQLNMPVINGLILGLIGLLVAITPLATTIQGRQLVMDLIAGGVLIVGGSFSLFMGLRRSARGLKQDKTQLPF